MEDDVAPYWDLNIIDEEELSPEERAQLPWNNLYEEDDRPKYKEEPDINLIYGFYEESEFY